MSLGRTSRAGSSQKYRGTCSSALCLSPLKLGTDAYIPFSVTPKILHTLVSSTCLTALWHASRAYRKQVWKFSLTSSEMCTSEPLSLYNYSLYNVHYFGFSTISIFNYCPVFTLWFNVSGGVCSHIPKTVVSCSLRRARLQ